MKIKSRRALFLSPHPDDIELGVGGTLSKIHSSGAEVHVAYLSTCEASLPNMPANVLTKESKLSMDSFSIGEKNRHYINFPVRCFEAHRQEILDYFVSLRQELAPDLVFLPCSADCHQDHQIVHNEGIRAFNRHSSILGYELPWNTQNFNAQFFSHLTREQLEAKLTAIRCYDSQLKLKRPYFRDEFIKGLAATRGVQAGTEYAEAFEVKSILWD